MLKRGKYRALRNIPIGWLSHAIHSTDVLERIFRIVIEALLILACFKLVRYWDVFESDTFQAFMASVLACHMITWFLDGNLVFMLDSFHSIRNPGIDRIIAYVKLCRKLFLLGDLCDSILIYGSMCRRKFHNRSDLDLRVLRRSDSWSGYLCLPIALLLRVYSFFIILPVDLQVADSMEFLNKQMREDELPIVVYLRSGFELELSGTSFREVEKNPSSVFISRA